MCTYPALQTLTCCLKNWYCNASFTSGTIVPSLIWGDLPYQMSLTFFSFWILCFISCSVSFSTLSTVPAFWDIHTLLLLKCRLSLASQIVFLFFFFIWLLCSFIITRLLLLPYLLQNYQDCVPKGSQSSLKPNTWAFSPSLPLVCTFRCFKARPVSPFKYLKPFSCLCL